VSRQSHIAAPTAHAGARERGVRGRGARGAGDEAPKAAVHGRQNEINFAQLQFAPLAREDGGDGDLDRHHAHGHDRAWRRGRRVRGGGAGGLSATSPVARGLQHDAQLDYYGSRLATCSSDRTIKVYAVAEGQPQQCTAEIKGCVWGAARAGRSPPRSSLRAPMAEPC